MSEYYAVKEADCSSEQIEQIFNLIKVSINADSAGYCAYEPYCWEFIVFKETKEIYQCRKAHLDIVSVELITPEEAILRLFETYLEK